MMISLKFHRRQERLPAGSCLRSFDLDYSRYLTIAGKPRPTLTWWRDYTIIDDSFEYNDKDGTRPSISSLACSKIQSD